MIERKLRGRVRKCRAPMCGNLFRVKYPEQWTCCMECWGIVFGVKMDERRSDVRDGSTI